MICIVEYQEQLPLARNSFWSKQSLAALYDSSDFALHLVANFVCSIALGYSSEWLNSSVRGRFRIVGEVHLEDEKFFLFRGGN